MASRHETDLYRVPAVRPPGLEQLRELSQSMGLQCTDDDLNVYQEYITGTLHSYDRISRLVGPSLPVKYSRTPGYRPSPEENTLNGWYWKCDIKGADDGKLAGKTLGIKDNVAVAGVPMMNGSKLLEGYMPEFDAAVVTRILDAGGRIVGKTNCEDLCCSGSSFTNVTGPTLNPHDRTKSSGGSSSGSAALVAAREIDMAIGGDQGGSIRIPASWCGIVGLKPTFGLVPYTGACPIEITIDHLGPMARTVYDCALLLEVIAGPDGDNDSRQPRNIQVPEYTKALSTDMKGKKIAMVTEGFTCCKQNVQDIVRKTALLLATKGAVVEEVSIPLHKDGISISERKNLRLSRFRHDNPIHTLAYRADICVLRVCEFHWMLNLPSIRFDSVASTMEDTIGVTIWAPIITEGGFNCIYRENGTGYHWKGYYPLSMQESLTRGFNLRPEDASEMFKAMMLFGAFIQKNYQNKFYAMAQNLNMMLTAAYNNVLEEYDVLLMPTMPFVAIDLPKMGCTLKDRLLSGIGMVTNTAPFNSTGHPAISINAGTSPEGLPVGMMIVGSHFDETLVLQIAYAYEQLLNS